jgi:hypothetical protein
MSARTPAKEDSWARPSTWRELRNSATLARSGNTSQALSSANQAIEIYRRSGPGDEPDLFARVLELHGLLKPATDITPPLLRACKKH